MPLYVNTRYRKKRRKKNISTKRIASKALHKVNKLLKQIEIKFQDKEISEADIDSDGSILSPLIDPAQGLTDLTRLGDRIHLISLQMRARIIPPSSLYPISTSLSTNTSQMRLIVYFDKQNIVDDVDDVLLPLSVANEDTLAPLRFWNRDKRKQFIVLYDKVFMMSQAYKDFHIINFYKKLNKDTVFNAGTITINTGSLKILVISNADPAGASNLKPDIRIHTRVTYSDT